MVQIVAAAPPEITLDSPEDGFQTNLQEVSFTFTVLDDNSSQILCSLFVDNEQKQNRTLDNPGRVTLKEILSAGNHTWGVECKDEQNQTTSISRSFSVAEQCGVAAYNMSVDGNKIKYFVKNLGTVDYFLEYIIKVDLVQIANEFVHLKVGEERIIEQNYTFQNGENYRIETSVDADCGSKDSLIIEYSLSSPDSGSTGVRCSNPSGSNLQIIGDPDLPRLIQCVDGLWIPYGDLNTYCASQYHCGDEVRNCGETESSCPEDFNLDVICDCSSMSYIVSSQNRSGAEFYNKCKNSCNLDCSSDSDCSNGYACSNYMCIIKPGACKISLENIETPPYSVVNESAYFLVKTRNNGEVPANVTLKLFVNNNLDGQFIFELDPGRVNPNTFYYNTGRDPGNYELRVRGESSCGAWDEKKASVEIFNKTVIDFNFTAPVVTHVDLIPESLTLKEGEEKSFKLNIKTNKIQWFQIDVSGVDERLEVDSKGLVGTGREKDTFIHVKGIKNGDYNFTVNVLGEYQNFTFTPKVIVLPVEKKNGQDLLLLLTIIILIFIIVISIGYKKLNN